MHGFCFGECFLKRCFICLNERPAHAPILFKCLPACIVKKEKRKAFQGRCLKGKHTYDIYYNIQSSRNFIRGCLNMSFEKNTSAAFKDFLFRQILKLLNWKPMEGFCFHADSVRVRSDLYNKATMKQKGDAIMKHSHSANVCTHCKLKFPSQAIRRHRVLAAWSLWANVNKSGGLFFFFGCSCKWEKALNFSQ